MPRRPKDIGTAGESAVAGYLRAAGFPHAERRALRGTLDCGDITGTPGVCWEVKAGAQTRPEQAAAVERWLEETETERQNSSSSVGVLVMQRHGFGSTRVSWWWGVLILEQLIPPGYDPGTRGTPAWLRLGDAVSLLRRVGYGAPLNAPAHAPGYAPSIGALRAPVPAAADGELLP